MHINQVNFLFLLLPAIFPRSHAAEAAAVTPQESEDQKKHYDIAYFGGPRLEAVGIATDQESHFH